LHGFQWFDHHEPSASLRCKITPQRPIAANERAELCESARIHTSGHEPSLRGCAYVETTEWTSGRKRASFALRRTFVPGYTDKSRRYLRLSVLNYQRAGDCNNPELKAKFFEIAGQYADLALQIDDPAAWHAKMISANTKPKDSAKSRQ
jgi:hypothetical protein